MAENRYTPGPWSFQMSHEDCCEFEVYVGSGTNSIDIVAGEYGIESEADARLIAAAPELLEALKDLIDDLEIRSKNGVVDCSHGVYCNARQAISKAEPHHPHTAEKVTQGGKSE